MTQRVSLAWVALTAVLFGCGASADDDPDGVASHAEEEPTEPEEAEAVPGSGAELPLAELAPGVDNPHGYPGCGDDPAAQPSPCIDPQGAVRCALDTGYPGDELALCALDDAEGMVLHFGPSDYDDPEAIEPFLLRPGEEKEFCMYLQTPNAEARYVNSYHGRMRPNSHHLIVTMPEAQEPSLVPFECGPQVLDRWFFGSQDPQIDVQNGGRGEKARAGDPDYGLAQVLPAHQTLLFDFHNLNTSESVELREAWASFAYVDAAEVQNTLDMLAFYQLDINVPPMSEATTPLKTCVAPEDRYIGLVTGHAHQWLSRFSVWHNATGGDSHRVYETYDWAEPGNATYRAAVENPPLPVAAGAAWGATSGYLLVKRGESISFECQYRNTEDREVRLGDTAGDEMCNVFGMYYPSDGNTWNCF